MPGDPHQCRSNAARCLALARRARRPAARRTFAAMAETWNKLAAETESDQALLRAISEMELGEPYETLPFILNLRSWPDQPADKVQGHTASNRVARSDGHSQAPSGNDGGPR
jgi:hypothetical protein